MRFDRRSLKLGKVALCLVATAASSYPQDPCVHGRPVLLYDSNTRTGGIVYQNYVNGLVPGASGVLPALPALANRPGFLCDGRPAEVWIINRRLKQVFSVTTNAVFALPSGLPEIRGLPGVPSIPQPTATGAAAAPAAKGGLTGTTPLTTDTIVEDLLNAETFDKAFQRLRDDGATVVEMHGFLEGLFQQYNASVLGLAGPLPVAPVGGPAPPFQGQAIATLGGTAQNFLNETARVHERFPPGGGADLARAEFNFDVLTGEIGQIILDVQRINVKLQGYPVVDVLVNLRSQVDVYEDSVRTVDHEYQNMNAAIEILADLRQLALAQPPNQNPEKAEYLKQRNAAEIRLFLTQRYGGSVGVLDAATISRIVDLYTDNRGDSSYRLGHGPNDLGSRLAHLQGEVHHLSANTRLLLGFPAGVEGFPDSRTADPFQGMLAASNANLLTLRDRIRDLNAAESGTFDAINAVYDAYRAPPISLNVDLQGNSGNLIVYYSVTGTEQFQRYRVANEVLQPQSACTQALAAGNATSLGTPNCTTPASGTASVAGAMAPAAAAPAASAPSAAAPAATAGAATAPASPPADFYGRFEVHHFVRGALVTGLAYDPIKNLSFSWVPCPTAPSSGATPGVCYSQAASGSTPGTTYQLIQSSSPQAAVVAGVNIYFRREDMFPGVERAWWQRYAPTAPFIGASVFPLNHYFLGGSAEPLRGLSVTLGGVVGSQTTLSSAYSLNQRVTATTQPTVPTSGRVHWRGFVMLGFDTSIFKAVFSSLWSNVTNVGTPPSASAGGSH